MAFKIILTRRAEEKLEAIIDYLQKEWGEKIVVGFLEKFYSVLDLLSEFPQIGTVEAKKRNIRGFLVTPHTRLFYRIEKDKIIVLNLFDNKQHPSKKFK